MGSHREARLADPYVMLVVFSIYSGAMGAVLLFGPRVADAGLLGALAVTAPFLAAERPVRSTG